MPITVRVKNPHTNTPYNYKNKVFDKPPQSVRRLTTKLYKKGLIISDVAAARSYIEKNGYFRFSGYLDYFLDGDRFKPHTTFEHICAAIEFDHKLRYLILAATSQVELVIRNRISEYMALKYQDAFWYLDLRLFNDPQKYQRELTGSLREFNRSGDDFIDHYFETYNATSHYPFPPCWMMFESMSFGSWSRLYGMYLNIRDKNAIARMYGLRSETLDSWIHSCSHLRNIAAHHGRLWNKTIHILPAHVPIFREFLPNSARNSFCARPLSVLHYLLHKIGEKNKSNTIIEHITSLAVPLQCVLGFKNGWNNHPFWIDPITSNIYKK